MAGSPNHNARPLVRNPVVWMALPLLLAGLSLLFAALAPERWVWGQVAYSSLLQAPRWLLLLWPPWALGFAWRHRRPLWLLLSLGPLPLAGIPFGLANAAPDRAWRVLSTNVNAFSPDPDPSALITTIAQAQLDLVIVIERRVDTIPGMVRVADNFQAEVSRESHRTAVFCREGLDCPASVTAQFGSESRKMPLALVRMPDGLCVMGIHGPPPVPYDPSGLIPYMERIAQHLDQGRISDAWGPCEVGDGVVVAGDLNHVTGSRAWRTLRAGGLSDALVHRGVFAASWPAGGGWPDFPYFQLDHLLVGQARVGAVHLSRMPGADHKGLWFSAAARIPGA